MNSEPDRKVTRTGSPHIKVRCLPEEKALIEQQARAAGLSAGGYLRKVGQGYTLRSVVDFEKVGELARISGDLGRLGGLLKLWLSNDERTRDIGPDTLRAVLKKIDRSQDAIVKTMEKVVMPRSSRR